MLENVRKKSWLSTSLVAKSLPMRSSAGSMAGVSQSTFGVKIELCSSIVRSRSVQGVKEMLEAIGEESKDYEDK
ncbi:hypothetical protein V6N12_034493 [Hibiscus sabdariffa]|uniref:Uncharacterized protein n=1 Tax=Hibiscus sabdariffa TaxID=183260 RepID=A0ABR2DHB8_9ROSI